ncbi:MAG: hypothetical protein EOO43_00520 [Flavobacterium sp.]|nr:MAG: hypothetical protein EOO43_00520 [Flavobacterium sp.]
MIGLYEYNALTHDDKGSMLWANGTYLTMRQEGHYKINLYSLSNFFVEAWYDPDLNKINEFKTFKSRHALEPYYDFIDLSQLLR